MRILVFHGYLLRGTGSNVYNARLCAALARLGHEVDLLSQDCEARHLDWVDAVGDWVDGRPRVEVLREPVRVTAWRPDIGGLLPVYVADRYPGIEARTFLECGEEEVARYVDANVAAVRDVVARARPDVALANHLVMGPLILARALAGEGVPYAVKIHGSALEYVVARDPGRFLPAAREGLAGAATVLVGSGHTASRLLETVPDTDDGPPLAERIRLGPPGVEIDEFRPRPREEAAEEIGALVAELGAQAAATGGPSAFTRDAAEAARALATLDVLGPDRHVAFVGKLIVSKGIDLLAAAWPLVLAEEPAARLVVVGFGGWQDALARLLAALASGRFGEARAIAEEGRAAEGGPRAPLRLLGAFLDRLEANAAAREAYVAAAASLGERVVLTGRLEHGELAPLLAACEAQVVPSTFPEAFGMVAAEAAAVGVLPVCAAHSGLAEVAAPLAEAVPEAVAPLLSFPVDAHAVEAIADRLVRWLRAPEALRTAARAALVATARARYGWDGVARGVIAAAEGRRDDLPRVPGEG